MKDHSVFIVDDDEAVRHSLVTLLRGQGVKARAFASGEDFFNRLPDTETACVVTDIRMPGMDGAEVVRRLDELRDGAWPVIVITGHADVPLAVQMMKAGVVDFIEKPFDPNRLFESLRGCLGLLRDRVTRQEAARLAEVRLRSLTARERQVFEALVEGKSNKQIALDLAISPRTVEIFRAKVMTKMQAENLPALVRMGLNLQP